jgi:hypothetical protein
MLQSHASLSVRLWYLADMPDEFMHVRFEGVKRT